MVLRQPVEFNAVASGRVVRNSPWLLRSSLRSRPMSAFLAEAQLMNSVNYIAASASVGTGPCLLWADYVEKLFLDCSVFR